jgi:uncharacterized alkaline shock family protein YloU
MDFDSASKVEEMIVKLDQNCKLAYGEDYCKQFDSKFKAIIGRASYRKSTKFDLPKFNEKPVDLSQNLEYQPVIPSVV